MALPFLDALILGVVEGLTEFLPVSSTGHLILVSHWLAKRSAAAGPAVDSYLVIIQLGALLAAISYYRQTYVALLLGLWQKRPEALRLLRNLCCSSLPVLGLGYLEGKWIKSHLFRQMTVAAALFVGGLVMLAMDFYVARRRPPTDPAAAKLCTAAELRTWQALLIGGVQALSLWPGTSRSMACIVGGQLAGLSTAAAADYTFMLALPTLGVATLYELSKSGPELAQMGGAAPMAVGLGVAFAVGLLVIAAFLRYLRRYGLWPFGCYRIVFGLLLLGLL